VFRLFVGLFGWRHDGRINGRVRDVVLCGQSRRFLFLFLGNRGLRHFDISGTAVLFFLLSLKLGLLTLGSTLSNPSHAARIILVVTKSGGIRAVLHDLPSGTHRRIGVGFVGPHTTIAPLDELWLGIADIGERVR